MEDAHRHPFADDDEILLAIVVVVDPRRRRYHPGAGECWRLLGCDVGEVSLPVVLEEVAARNLTVVASDVATSDEEIDVAVAIEVARHHARTALGEARQRLHVTVKVAIPVVDVEAILKRVVVTPELVSAAHDVQVEMAVAIRIEEHRVD